MTRATVRERLWREPLRTVAVPFYDMVQDERQTVVKRTGLLSVLSSGSGPEIMIEYRALLGVPPAAIRPPAVEKTIPVEKALPAQETGTLPAAAVEERLRMLKRLREQGLITEEEYREKKKEVLGSF